MTVKIICSLCGGVFDGRMDAREHLAEVHGGRGDLVEIA